MQNGVYVVDTNFLSSHDTQTHMIRPWYILYVGKTSLSDYHQHAHEFRNENEPNQTKQTNRFYSM